MNALERLAFDAGMRAWAVSRKRPDLDEEARVKGALLAYQRQVIAYEIVRDSEKAKKT